MAYIYILLYKYEEAANACAQAYKGNKTITNYYRNWAIALFYLKRYQEAENIIKLAIEKSQACESKPFINVNNKKKTGPFWRKY